MIFVTIVGLRVGVSSVSFLAHHYRSRVAGVLTLS